MEVLHEGNGSENRCADADFGDVLFEGLRERRSVFALTEATRSGPSRATQTQARPSRSRVPGRATAPPCLPVDPVTISVSFCAMFDSFLPRSGPRLHARLKQPGKR